jgi:uncharacterized protein (DUF302 family)
MTKEPLDANTEHDARCDCASGLVSLRTRRSVAEAVEAMRRLLEAKGIRLFAVIDHAAAAHAVDLSMPPTVVLIFGDPRAGTPLMLATPTIAIDLPLKVLVAEDAEGAVWISYVAPARMTDRHGVPASLTRPLDGLEMLVSQLLTQL